MNTATKPDQPCDAELWVMAGKYPIPAQQFIDVARDVLNKFGAGQDAARAEPVVTLTGAQLLQALDFLAPDRDTDPTQLEGDATIAYGDGHAGKGYYCYFADCPDEGSTLLDAEAPDAPTALVSADPDPDQQRITAWAAVWFEINRLDPNAGRRAPKGVDCALSAIREWHRAASAPVAAPVSAEPVAQVAEDFIFFLRKQPNGDRWPVGTKLYADAVAAQQDAEKLLFSKEDLRAVAREVSADKVDAERYRFIRDGEQDVWCSSGDWPLSGAELDTAIDAARKEQA